MDTYLAAGRPGGEHAPLMSRASYIYIYIYIYGAYPGAYLVTCVSENLYINIFSAHIHFLSVFA